MAASRTACNTNVETKVVMEVRHDSMYECESRTVKKAYKNRAQCFYDERIEANFDGFVD